MKGCLVLPPTRRLRCYLWQTGNTKSANELQPTSKPGVSLLISVSMSRSGVHF